jgi:hypothetical protein
MLQAHAVYLMHRKIRFALRESRGLPVLAKLFLARIQ